MNISSILSIFSTSNISSWVGGLFNVVKNRASGYSAGIVEDVLFGAFILTVGALYFYYVPLWGHIIALTLAGSTAILYLRNRVASTTDASTSAVSPTEAAPVEAPVATTPAPVANTAQ